MNSRRAARLVVISIWMTGVVPPVLAAELLSDPTRPSAVAGGIAQDSASVSGSSELQSILQVPGRKPRALISGQWVEQGQLYGDSRVVKISAGSVILQDTVGGKNVPRQVLTLTPGISKTKPVVEQPKRAVEIK